MDYDYGNRTPIFLELEYVTLQATRDSTENDVDETCSKDLTRLNWSSNNKTLDNLHVIELFLNIAAWKSTVQWTDRWESSRSISHKRVSPSAKFEFLP